MSEYKKYRKKGIQLMRPYEPGESLKGVSVSELDKSEISMLIDGIIPKEQVGMIAVDPFIPEDKWYVNYNYFTNNYEEAE